MIDTLNGFRFEAHRPSQGGLLLGMKKLASLLLLSLGLVQAASRGQTAPNIHYLVDKDAMTDANHSLVVVRELNDATSSTAIVLKCDAGAYHVYLQTKNPLMTQSQYDAGDWPGVLYRIDSHKPLTAVPLGASFEGEPTLTALSFTPSSDAALHGALVAGNKVTVRIIRTGLSNLDYVFPAKGYIAAFTKVNRCK